MRSNKRSMTQLMEDDDENSKHSSVSNNRNNNVIKISNPNKGEEVNQADNEDNEEYGKGKGSKAISEKSKDDVVKFHHPPVKILL